jgi:hypothetical protein
VPAAPKRGSSHQEGFGAVSSPYDRDLIVATMKSNGFGRIATAEIVGCNPYTVTRQMQMEARPLHNFDSKSQDDPPR